MQHQNPGCYDKRRPHFQHGHGGSGAPERGSADHHGSSSASSGHSSTKYDDPPNSRLFIVCGKNITEDHFKVAFSAFGVIEEVWVLKDRITGEPKGVTYIKFSKTSEAALAMEEMNGRCIEGSPRPLKVLIAHSRDQGSRREMNEEERLLRLFVVVPKHMTEQELKEKFLTFGDLDYVSIVKDRNSKESKGFGYVKYHRMSHAAKAFEECDRIFKPVFADPKPQKSTFQDAPGSHQTGPGSTASGSTATSISASYDMLAYLEPSQTNPDGICRLLVSTAPNVNQDQIWRLFDIVPGLDFCDRAKNASHKASKIFVVVYNNPQSAIYAREKLHGFEYPPGQRIVVRLEAISDLPRQISTSFSPSASGSLTQGSSSSIQSAAFLQGSMNNALSPTARQVTQNAPTVTHAGKTNIQADLAQLTETIANATALLQAAGYSSNSPHLVVSNPMSNSLAGNAANEIYDPAYCSVKLPSPQPLAAMESVVAERLFLVCSPIPPQLYALKDVFGRFGNLIDIYILNGKTCGYAKYAKKDSAEKAIAALHGQEICGSRLKVMPADPQDKTSQSVDSNRKRPKISDTEL